VKWQHHRHRGVSLGSECVVDELGVYLNRIDFFDEGSHEDDCWGWASHCGGWFEFIDLESVVNTNA